MKLQDIRVGETYACRQPRSSDYNPPVEYNHEFDLSSTVELSLDNIETLLGLKD